MNSSKHISQSLLNRREFVKGVAAVSVGELGLGMAAGKQSVNAGRGKRPNVLFIFFDQMRADACGVYGGRDIQTPYIDRLAGQGARFTNALSTCPLCTPYRGMVMTGRYPTHSGLVLNGLAANPNQRCLGHIFRDFDGISG